jgi:hypothetical protein
MVHMKTCLPVRVGKDKAAIPRTPKKHEDGFSHLINRATRHERARAV